MISTLMPGLAVSKAATASVTMFLEVLSQVASLMVTSPEAGVLLLAAEDAWLEEAAPPQPASMVPVSAVASSIEMLFS